MDWTRGYSCKWRAYEVDTATWADGTQLPNIVSASVERDVTDDAPLIESGSIQITAQPNVEFGERYVRLVMIAEQDGGKARVEVATLLCSSSSGTIERGADTLELTGKSVLWPASTTKIKRGEYLPKGMNGAEWCRARLADTIQAPVKCHASFRLNDYFVLDVGQSVLEAVWLVLKSGNCCIQIDGDGTVHIRKLLDGTNPDDIALTLNRANARLLSPGISHELDWSEVPNRYVAIDGNKTATVTNTWKSSPTSTVTRGYLYEEVDMSPVCVDGESLSDYAKRRLEEVSTARDVRSYVREWWPDVHPFSLVGGSIGTSGLDADMRVERQSYECGHGIRVTEQAAREVKAWHR